MFNKYRDNHGMNVETYAVDRKSFRKPDTFGCSMGDTHGVVGENCFQRPDNFGYNKDAVNCESFRGSDNKFRYKMHDVEMYTLDRKSLRGSENCGYAMSNVETYAVDRKSLRGTDNDYSMDDVETFAVDRKSFRGPNNFDYNVAAVNSETSRGSDKKFGYEMHDVETYAVDRKSVQRPGTFDGHVDAVDITSLRGSGNFGYAMTAVETYAADINSLRGPGNSGYTVGSVETHSVDKKLLRMPASSQGYYQQLVGGFDIKSHCAEYVSNSHGGSECGFVHPQITSQEKCYELSEQDVRQQKQPMTFYNEFRSSDLPHNELELTDRRQLEKPMTRRRIYDENTFEHLKEYDTQEFFAPTNGGFKNRPNADMDYEKYQRSVTGAVYGSRPTNDNYVESMKNHNKNKLEDKYYKPDSLGCKSEDTYRFSYSPDHRGQNCRRDFAEYNHHQERDFLKPRIECRNELYVHPNSSKYTNKSKATFTAAQTKPELCASNLTEYELKNVGSESKLKTAEKYYDCQSEFFNEQDAFQTFEKFEYTANKAEDVFEKRTFKTDKCAKKESMNTTKRFSEVQEQNKKLSENSLDICCKTEKLTEVTEEHKKSPEDSFPKNNAAEKLQDHETHKKLPENNIFAKNDKAEKLHEHPVDEESKQLASNAFAKYLYIAVDNDPSCQLNNRLEEIDDAIKDVESTLKKLFDLRAEEVKKRRTLKTQYQGDKELFVNCAGETKNKIQTVVDNENLEKKMRIFIDWCLVYMKKNLKCMEQKFNMMEFLHMLIDVETETEIAEYLNIYFENSFLLSQFAQEFIKRRNKINENLPQFDKDGFQIVTGKKVKATHVYTEKKRKKK